MTTNQPQRGFLVLLSVIVALIALCVSVYSITSSKQYLDELYTLKSAHESLQQELLTARSQADGLKEQISQLTSTREIPSPSGSESVRLVTRPLGNIASTLDTELDMLASRIQSQFPNQAEAFLVVAMYKAQTRQYVEAQNLFEKCIELSPENEMFWINLASIAIEQGKNQMALETLLKARTKGFQSFNLLYHLGLAHSNLGQFEDAAKVVDESLSLAPHSGAAWLMRGQTKLELGDLLESEASFRKAMELGVSSPSLYVGLGNACLRQGKRDEAKEFLATFAELKEKDTLTGAERYQVLNEQEIQRTATTVFTEASAFFFKRKDYLEAERLLLRCVAMDPASLSSLRALADLYYRTNKLNEEKLVRDRIVSLGSLVLNDYIDLAKAQAVSKDRNAAEGTLKLAMTVFPTAIEPYAALSQFHLETSSFDKARWYAQQSIECKPTVEGFRFLASICDKMGDRSGAAQALAFAKELEVKK